MTLSLTSDKLNTDIINLVSFFPVSDEEGRAASGTNFTLTNNGNIMAYYNLRILEDLDSIASDGFLNNSNYDIQMSKNTEWRAVAYLSQSKYGKYGNFSYSDINKEVAINNCITTLQE